MITHQEPDAKLTEKPLVMLVVLLVIEFNVVEGVVGGGEAHLTAPVQLELTLLGVNFCFFQKTSERRRRRDWERMSREE